MVCNNSIIVYDLTCPFGGQPMLGYISVEVQLNKLSELAELVMGYILLLCLILNSHSRAMHYSPIMHCDKLRSITRPAHCVAT